MTAREDQEREQGRRDRLGSYFFDLTKLTFAGLVLGCISPLFTNGTSSENWSLLLLGGIATYTFAFYANRILKTK